MSRHYFLYLALFIVGGCTTNRNPVQPSDAIIGCDGKPYPALNSTPYVIPFAVGTIFSTGLANCSSSYHGPGQPDQYATDFDLPTGTHFTAARAGTVSFLDEDERSEGGGAGNMVIIDHGDGTSALYLHSPENGIFVNVGDQVVQGDTLGIVGRSGLAGYPHLHFIVVEGSTVYPYQGIPVSFSNASPADLPLQTRTFYKALPY